MARMYRKLERFGAQALSRRELRLLKRESDEGVRNPGRGHHRSSERGSFQRHAQTKAPSQRDWEGFTRIKRMMRVNPKGRGRARRNPLTCRMSKESMFHELKHHGSHYRPQKQRVAIVLSSLRKCHRRNPKRDGSPTRGELRKGKYSTYLKTISQRGKDAEAILARVHGVPATSSAAVKEHVPSASVAVMDAPPAKIEAVVEHAEAKHLRSRIDELNILHKDLLAQVNEMGDDDLAAYEVSQLQDQAAKIAKQRGLLRAKAQQLGIMTNPRPRGHRHQVLVGLNAYGQALKRLHQAIHAHRR